jgi:hypothetical protein
LWLSAEEIMSNSNDDPVISYDPDGRIVTIDGFRFTRELFSTITVSPPGIRFRIVSRENGVIALSQERDPLEIAAPDMLAALHAALNWFTPPNDSGPFPLKQIAAAIAKAETVPV